MAIGMAVEETDFDGHSYRRERDHILAAMPSQGGFAFAGVSLQYAFCRLAITCVGR